MGACMCVCVRVFLTEHVPYAGNQPTDQPPHALPTNQPTTTYQPLRTSRSMLSCTSPFCLCHPELFRTNGATDTLW